jgi:septal ring factor EnvC (AmiA/AmiB activator)
MITSHNVTISYDSLIDELETRDGVIENLHAEIAALRAGHTDALDRLERVSTACNKARAHRDRLLDERDTLVKERDERMATHSTEQDAIMSRLAKEYPTT